MKPPFGFRVDPTGKQRLVAYEPEAKIVRVMFEMASKGASSREIAEVLNLAGIPYPGERLDKQYIDRFFQYMHWNNPEVEPIVDVKVFQQAQENLKRERP